MCAAAFPAAAQAAEPGPPTPAGAWTALVKQPVYATAKPGRGSPTALVGRTTPHWGGPNVLLVLDARSYDGVDYVKVLLKHMPAGSTGWIAADHVKLSPTRRRVVVDRSDRTIKVFDGRRKILHERVVVGAPSTPTPVGQFAVDAPVDQKGGILGDRVLALVAYSRALARYQGGIPQVAFHEYEKLGAPLGTAASHGCIRMARETLKRVRKLAPRGTPVLIRR